MLYVKPPTSKTLPESERKVSEACTNEQRFGRHCLCEDRPKGRGSASKTSARLGVVPRESGRSSWARQLFTPLSPLREAEPPKPCRPFGDLRGPSGRDRGRCARHQGEAMVFLLEAVLLRSDSLRIFSSAAGNNNNDKNNNNNNNSKITNNNTY